MYHINNSVLYGTEGVCIISEIEEKEMGGEHQQYYVLKPVYRSESTIYVPVNSEKLTSKMRRVLSADEVYELIKTMPEEGTIWIDNKTDRQEKYKRILLSGDRTELIRLIKTLYLRQQAQKEMGKKLYVADENMMKDAERILYEEFAHVLDIEREQVFPMILEQIDPEEKKHA